MLSDHVAAMAAAIATPLVMAWLARSFPAKTGTTTGPTLEELAPKYAKWERLFIAIYVLSWAPVTFAAWLLLRELSDWNAATLGPAEILLTADPWFWALPALFLALVLPAAPLTALARKLLGPRFTEYDRYLALKYKFDYARVNRRLYQGVGWTCGIAIFLGLNWYVAVRGDALVVNRLFSLAEDVHPYMDFRSIQSAPQLIAPNGNVVARREYLVTFTDGSHWSTMSLPREQDAQQKAALAHSLSMKSGVAIEEIGVFEKHALW